MVAHLACAPRGGAEFFTCSIVARRRTLLGELRLGKSAAQSQPTFADLERPEPADQAGA